MKATVIAAAIVLLTASSSHADTFGIGANTFDIEFVTIGNPGNADDTTGVPNPAGKVDYIYRMGQFEISEEMIDKANTLGGLGLAHDGRRDSPRLPDAALASRGRLVQRQPAEWC